MTMRVGIIGLGLGAEVHVPAFSPGHVYCGGVGSR